ncbi:MAG: hypothetical protein JWM74_2999 [Myxococcaceae bacterium]|nr:hypothetical protein [Myxococcaceae bacterium]
MMRTRFNFSTLFVVVLCSTVLGSLPSCGGDDVSSNDLEFHGEGDVMPNFSFDTGLVPAGSKVQVQFVLTAAGKVSADAKAEQGGPSDSPSVVGKAGSGKLAVDGHFKLQGKLKIAVSGLPEYDGPIPNLENVDIKFGGEKVFDPFLLGTSTNVITDIPETKLPPIPLPGGLTGQLVITIAKGSTVNSEFAGVCAAVSNGKASYVGKTATTGVLKLKPTVVLKIPIKGDTSFDLPEIPISLPAKDTPLDLGTRPASGTGATRSGPPAATAIQGSCSPTGGPGGDGGTDPGLEGGTSDGAAVVDAAGVAFYKHPDITWDGSLAAGTLTEAECRKGCSEDANCAGYQFVQPNACTAFLQFSFATQSTFAPGAAASYVRDTLPLSKFNVEYHLDHAGGDLQQLENMNATTCAAQCDANSSCVAFSLVSGPPNQGRCWLKGAPLSAAAASSDIVAYCKRGVANCNGR